MSAERKGCLGCIRDGTDHTCGFTEPLNDGALDAQGRVHNHAPWRPMCNERVRDGQLRGACLDDDDDPAPTPPDHIRPSERPS